MLSEGARDMYMMTLRGLMEKLVDNDKESAWNETLEKVKKRYLTVFEKVMLFYDKVQ